MDHVSCDRKSFLTPATQSILSYSIYSATCFWIVKRKIDLLFTSNYDCWVSYKAHIQKDRECTYHIPYNFQLHSEKSVSLKWIYVKNVKLCLSLQFALTLVSFSIHKAQKHTTVAICCQLLIPARTDLASVPINFSIYAINLCNNNKNKNAFQ